MIETAAIDSKVIALAGNRPNGRRGRISVGLVLLPDFSISAFAAIIDLLRVSNRCAGENLFAWRTYSEFRSPVYSSSGIAIAADETLPRRRSSEYIILCGGEDRPPISATLSSWVREQWTHGQTVCGFGSAIYTLAESGILA